MKRTTPVDEKLRYIREKLTNAKGFHLLGQTTESKYRFEVEGDHPFEYVPSVVFLFDEEFVANVDSIKLAEFVDRAIALASKVLKDPPSKKCNLQGWIKAFRDSVTFVPSGMKRTI